MPTILGRAGMELTPEYVERSGHALECYENIRTEGQYIVGDKKKECIQHPGTIYLDVDTGRHTHHPGHSIELLLRDGKLKPVATLEDIRAARRAAIALNNIQGCTIEQLSCSDAGKRGRTSPQGMAPRPAKCPMCEVDLVPDVGPFMKHPSLNDVPAELRHLLGSKIKNSR